MGAGATPAGWYPDPEQPGGERYWNGSLWTEDRRPATTAGAPGTPSAFDPQPQYAATPAAPAGYAAYGAPTPQYKYPSSQMAGWGLGVSIVGLVFVCCGGVLLSIPGAVMGWVHMKGVERGERDPGTKGLGTAAFVVGLSGSLLFVPFVIYFIAVGFTV